MRQIKILIACNKNGDKLFFTEAIKRLDLVISLKWVVNGSELLTFLKNPDIELPELIILDLDMPHKRGIE